MEKIKMSVVSLQRILRIAVRVKECDKFEINTLNYLIDQCNEAEQRHLVQKYGEELPFLKERFEGNEKNSDISKQIIEE